ncbi:MAG: CoA transferase, partial [Rhodospirillales bacterium]
LHLCLCGRDDWISRQWEGLPQAELIAEVADLLAGRPLDHWLSVLDGVDACVQPVAEYAGVADQPQVKARDLVADDPLGGVQVLLPILADGMTTGERAPLALRTADQILRGWEKA